METKTRYTGLQVVMGEERNKEVKKLIEGDRIFNAKGKLDTVKSVKHVRQDPEFIRICLKDKTTFEVSRDSYIPLFNTENVETLHRVQALYLLDPERLKSVEGYYKFFINPVFLFGEESLKVDVNPYILGLLLGCSGRPERLTQDPNLHQTVIAGLESFEVKKLWSHWKLKGEEMSRLRIQERISIVQGMMDARGKSTDSGYFFSTGCWNANFVICKLIRSVGGVALLQPAEKGWVDFTKKPSTGIFIKDVIQLFRHSQRIRPSINERSPKLKRTVTSAELVKGVRNIYEIDLESGNAPLLFDCIGLPSPKPKVKEDTGS